MAPEWGGANAEKARLVLKPKAGCRRDAERRLRWLQHGARSKRGCGEARMRRRPPEGRNARANTTINVTGWGGGRRAEALLTSTPASHRTLSKDSNDANEQQRSGAGGGNHEVNSPAPQLRAHMTWAQRGASPRKQSTDATMASTNTREQQHGRWGATRGRHPSAAGEDPWARGGRAQLPRREIRERTKQRHNDDAARTH